MNNISPATLAECKHFCPEIYRDIYRDATGIRPRFDMSHMTAAELDAEYLSTSEAADRVLNAEEIAQLEAEIAFDKRLDALVALGAGNRRTAFRWMLSAEGILDEVRSERDFSYVCYRFNLPYSMAAELGRML